MTTRIWNQIGNRVSVDGRQGEIISWNAHLDLWAVRYDNEPGMYYHVADSRCEYILPTGSYGRRLGW